jgi:hypothetical protein
MIVECFPFNVAPGTAALSHRMFASAGTSRDSYSAQDSDKINVLQYPAGESSAGGGSGSGSSPAMRKPNGAFEQIR